jgi:GntR family transcriptional repressor for pyruvate dehydrogenase complex
MPPKRAKSGNVKPSSRRRQADLAAEAKRSALESTDAADDLQFRPVTDGRAFEEIARQIRSDLAEGRLKVGSRLPRERVMAAQMNVSRHVLREALRSLENAGLRRD